MRIGTPLDDKPKWTGDVDLNAWPRVDELALTPPRRAQYLRRAQAIRLYLEGATDAQIKAACGIGRGHAYRLLTERCLQPHPDGHVYGWRGALPHVRVKPYTWPRPVCQMICSTAGRFGLHIYIRPVEGTVVPGPNGFRPVTPSYIHGFESPKTAQVLSPTVRPVCH